jgi:transposase
MDEKAYQRVVEELQRSKEAAKDGDGTTLAERLRRRHWSPQHEEDAMIAENLESKDKTIEALEAIVRLKQERIEMLETGIKQQGALIDQLKAAVPGFLERLDAMRETKAS